MDTQMAHVAPVTPGRSLPTITIQRMLEMTTTSRRFKIELVIPGVKNSSLTGKPIPHKSEWQQHLAQHWLLVKAATEMKSQWKRPTMIPPG
jgi:hypothetical protein